MSAGRAGGIGSRGTGPAGGSSAPADETGPLADGVAGVGGLAGAEDVAVADEAAIASDRRQVDGLLLGGTRPSLTLGVAAAVASVALATLAIYPLEHVAPVVSLSVVYLPAVLLIATYWGLGLGVATAVLGAAAFNFYHLPPVGKFTIADSRNWVALLAFLIVALVAGTIAELARARAVESERRRAEADLAAALARELLLGQDTGRALGTTARRVAEALGLPSAAIELGVAMNT